MVKAYQKGVTLWFTGLSGAGKTTMALKIEELLRQEGLRVERLDGDIVREHLTRDLGFSKEDRDENIRRNSFVAALLTRNEIITLCCFISPYRQARNEARQLIGSFVEVYVNAPLDECRRRDVKGLYAEAEAGRIPEFTGISAPYEPPLNPEIELRTDRETVSESAEKVIAFLKNKGYISTGYADLHLHTNASDGLLPPRQVVEKAKAAGLATIAITDHDTTAGIAEAIQAGVEHGLEVITGIEISTIDGDKEVHILGYYINPDHPALAETIAKITEARKNRAAGMVEKLNKLGIEISFQRVKELAGNDTIGRPHIAGAMLEKGFITEIGEAFTKDYIASDGKAYVERYNLTPGEAIDLIKKAGGIPVLAHPGFLTDRSSLQEETLEKYIACGLQGIEVYYSCHTLKQVYYYYEIAQMYNLIITGGSDCHGNKEPLLGSVKLTNNNIVALKKAQINLIE